MMMTMMMGRVKLVGEHGSIRSREENTPMTIPMATMMYGGQKAVQLTVNMEGGKRARNIAIEINELMDLTLSSKGA